MRHGRVNSPRLGAPNRRCCAPPRRVRRAFQAALKQEGLDGSTELARGREMTLCSSCGSDGPQGANFCARCGARLSAQPEAVGERRQLTVLFCDLVDSTKLSADLDPEDYREVVQAYQSAAKPVLDQLGGRIAQFLGDGLLVYFGHPRAHEDDAQRAVLAGLLIITRVSDITLPQLGESRIAARAGIHSGLVVMSPVGEGEAQELLALGETPNVAARLQSLATPGRVVISQDTRVLIEDLFDLTSMGRRELKGLSRAIEVFEVTELSKTRQKRGDASLTPMVDRRDERARLYTEWAQANSEGRLLLVGGAPGIGKSRLLGVLREQVAAEEQLALDCRCLPYFANTTLYPLLEGLSQLLAIAPAGTDDRLATVERAATRYGITEVGDIATLATVLGVPLSERYQALPQLPPRKQKDRSYAVLVLLLRAIVSQRRLLFILEDAHWADPSTLELLEELVRSGLPPGLLIVVTVRPAEAAAIGFGGVASRMDIPPLGSEEITEIAGLVAHGKRLPAALLDQVIANTDGTPLFVEELTKMVLASEALIEREDGYELRAPVEHLAIPVTLRDSLAARLDQLGEHRSIAQLAAVIGREFAEELLRAIGPDERRVTLGLEALVASGLVERQGTADYRFRHALIQETAYGSLLRTTRRAHHAKIAAALERSLPSATRTHPELIARHFTEASMGERAIPYWKLAAESAASRFANREAVAFFQTALGLLPALPATQQRAADELSLLIAMGPPLIATEGYASDRVAQVYERARQICADQGEGPQQFPILFGLVAYYLARGELHLAVRLGERLLSVTERANDPAYVEAHFALGMSRFYLGEFDAARQLLTRGADLHDPSRHQAVASLYAFDPGTGCRRALGLALWLLGRSDDAVAFSDDAITLAERQENPYGLAAALVFAATLRQFHGERDLVAALADRARVLSSERGFAFWLAWAGILASWADATSGRASAARVRALADTAARGGALLMYPYYLALAADAFLHERAAADGLAATSAALATVARTGERWWEAEIYRLQARLLLLAGDNAGSGESARRAVAVARELGAVALESRARTDLAATN
jgi:class 3 adenylate cyclase/predicted ATPase